MESSTVLPKVTIITPSYNQGRFLEATIQSVLGQDYPNFEYMIVDGDSKDESVEVIKKYQDRMAWWVSEKDQGHADALNKGFARATGEIRAWINSDDTYFPGAVSDAVAVLMDHPEVGMVYGDARLIDESGKTMGQFAAKQTDYRSMLRGSVHIPQATTFWRASLQQQAGPMDTTFAYAFDYDFWVRLAKLAEIRYVPRLWASFRIHDRGKTVLIDDLCYPDMIRVHDRELGGGLSQLRVRALARKMLYTWMPMRLRLWLRKAVTF